VKRPFYFFVLSSCLTFAACSGGILNTKAEVQHGQVSDSEIESGPELLFCEIEGSYLKPETSWAELDLWDRLRHGYQLPSQDMALFEQELSWYKTHPSYIERVVKRGAPYIHHIIDTLEQRDMPLEIALLPIVESAFDPFAYSPGRASGMWQIIPGTGRALGLKQNWWYDGRRDVIASTDAALDYLESLNKRFGGDWLLALAAYNSGGGTVSKAIKRNTKKGLATDFWSLKLPKETQGYVPRLLALAELFEQPEKYGLSLDPAQNEPYFASVELPYQIDLAQAAELAGISMEEMYKLNPGFNRWATDPSGPHRLVIPIEKSKRFQRELSQFPKEQSIKWVRHLIAQGETLSHIASRYKVTVDTLQEVNNLSGSRIRVGKTLMVPKAQKGLKHYSHAMEQRVTRKQNAYSRPNKTKVIHKVKKGDSFWSLAKRYKTRSASIAKWNSMAPKDTLSIGQELVIWTDSGKQVATNFANDAVVRKLSYRVRSGDSLARIAQKFRVRVNDIVRWNGIDQGKYLQPGQALTLFVNIKS